MNPHMNLPPQAAGFVELRQFSASRHHKQQGNSISPTFIETRHRVKNYAESFFTPRDHSWHGNETSVTV